MVKKFLLFLKIVEWAKAKCPLALLLKLSIAYGACALAFEFSAQAQSAKEITKSPDWTRATVITDGAAVYTKTDFDSTVSEYLVHGTKIWILKKPSTGAGGLGLFHRVRYKAKAGYMADTDIRIVGKSGAGSGDKKGDDKGKDAADGSEAFMGSKAWEKEEQEESKGREPLYFTRHVGGALAMIKYSEKFSGKALSSQMFLGGLRMTGPGVLFDGPPLDMNILFTPATPDYYSRVTDKSVKGFLVFGDVMAIFPFMDRKSTLLYYGMGLMWNYASYKVQVKNSQFDSQEVRLGVEFGLGGVFKITRSLVARLDGKYFIEKTQYYGLITSLQTEF